MCVAVIGEHACTRPMHSTTQYHHCGHCGAHWMQTFTGEIVDWIEL